MHKTDSHFASFLGVRETMPNKGPVGWLVMLLSGIYKFLPQCIHVRISIYVYVFIYINIIFVYICLLIPVDDTKFVAICVDFMFRCGGVFKPAQLFIVTVRFSVKSLAG